MAFLLLSMSLECSPTSFLSLCAFLGNLMKMYGITQFVLRIRVSVELHVLESRFLVDNV